MRCLYVTLTQLSFLGHLVLSIEVDITIDNHGSLMIDNGEEHNLKSEWWATERFTLPGDIKAVTIKANNTGDVGGILASFSNGVLTDSTWKCPDMSSCTTAECENAATWQDATAYGVSENKPPPWKRRLANIESTAQWIWAINQYATKV